MKRFGMLAFVLWLAFGLRLLYDHAVAPNLSPLELRIPFEELPMDVVGGGWDGRNVILSPEVVQAVGLSDFLQREYRSGDRSFLLFVGYVSGGFPDAVHSPHNDTPAESWKLESQGTTTIPCVEMSQPLRFLESVWSNRHGERTYTLSSFYSSGKLEPELHFRVDRRHGARYFATVALSGPVVGDLTETRCVLGEVVTHLMPTLLRHLP
jgi:hypothetical protein